MPTIFIGGYYGAGNLGDEAILDSMLRDMRQLRSDLSFIVTSWNPNQTSEQYEVEAVHWNDINGILASGQKSDLILLGGGGLFQDYWGIDPETYLRKGSWDITSYGSLPLLAKLLDIPCMIYAIGLGPLQSKMALDHTRMAFEHCQVASLRDFESLELLERTGFELDKIGGPVIEVLADPVFSLIESDEDDNNATSFLRQRKIEQGTELIAVSLRYWDRSGSLMDWLPSIAEGINQYLRENSHAQVILIPFQVNEENLYTNDAAVLKRLFHLLIETPRIHTIEEDITPRFAQALIKKCSVVLGMRLHALILGINASTPIVALPYDPKVSSLMRRAGLEEFCCDSISPKPEDLVAKLKAAQENLKDSQVKFHTLRTQLASSARKNATLAVGLLRGAQRVPINFVQGFALERSKLLVKLDETQAQLEKENRALRSQLRSQLMQAESLDAELKEIHASNFWKLAKYYYGVVENSPVRYLYRFLVTWRREGARRAFGNVVMGVWQKFVNLFQTRTRIRILSRIIASLNSRPLKGIFVVTSAFVFDEFYNQRVINLSKFLAKENWGVIYVAWRWGKNDPMPGIGTEVSKNIFQIPIDFLLECDDILAKLEYLGKYFVVELPYPEFLSAAIELRRYGFKILYEIIDEWEEFHKVGQAAWFNKAFEDSIVLNANFLTAVSQPLVEKFSRLRHDIHLLPNGFDPALLGFEHRDVAQKAFEKDEIKLGYFGHLTDSWFDWELLLEVLRLAKERGLNLHFHLIGYGEANLERRLVNYQDRIHLHGKVAPSELHKYASGWDAAMIPFKAGKLSEAVDPIKIYEYLYFGLPVIVNGIQHLKDLPGVCVIANAEQFLHAVGQLPRLKQEKIKADGLDQFTWERRFLELLKILESKEWMSL